MSYWKAKVLPKIQKTFTPKKLAAAEATKSFDGSKEEINKEFEEKKAELEPKVLEIYEASSAELKTLVKTPTEAGLKKHSVAVTKFLEELVKIDFPGSKPVSEAAAKIPPFLVSGMVLFVFDKVSFFIPADEITAPPAAAEEPAVAAAAAAAAVEESSSKDKAVEVEVVATEKEVETVTHTPPPPSAATEPAKAVPE